MLVSREASSDFESLNPVLEGISDDTVLAIEAEDSLNGVTARLRNVHKEESVSERQHLVVVNHRSSAVCLRLTPVGNETLGKYVLRCAVAHTLGPGLPTSLADVHAEFDDDISATPDDDGIAVVWGIHAGF